MSLSKDPIRGRQCNPFDGTVSILNPDGVVVAATGHRLRAGGGSPGSHTDFACRAHVGEGTFEVQESVPTLDDQAVRRPRSNDLFLIRASEAVVRGFVLASRQGSACVGVLSCATS
jgi:hypothetical protein